MLDSGAASCMIQDAHRMRHWRGASNIIPWDWCGFPLQGDSVLLFHVVGGQTFSTIHCHTCHDCCRPSNTIVSSAQTIRQWAVQSAFRALSASMWPGFKCAKLSVQIEPYLKPGDILIWRSTIYNICIQYRFLLYVCLHAYIMHLLLIYVCIYRVYTDTLTCTVYVILFKH